MEEDQAPGRDYFLEFVAKHGAMSRTRFLGRHTKPVLLITSEASAAATGFRSSDTHIPTGGNPAPSELPFYIYAIDKRPGANTTPAITLGRSATNDLVVPDPGVSRIHAAFFVQKDERMTIADASTLGTWVDGEKLEPKKHRWLGHSHQLQLGPAVFATFMVPERLFELVAKTLPR
jgi:pSer/pThr/pTyr-binding forkhead associated (FHA) protein